MEQAHKKEAALHLRQSRMIVTDLNLKLLGQQKDHGGKTARGKAYELLQQALVMDFQQEAELL